MTKRELTRLEGAVRDARLRLREASLLPPGSTRARLERGARLDLLELREVVANERAFAQFVHETREANDGELPPAVVTLIRQRDHGRAAVRDYDGPEAA